MKKYDVAVIGLGVVGAAALWHLADAGVRAVGLDAFGPTHQLGSSSGESRIFRRAYWEGASYLPLLDRADELWRVLQDRCGETIIVPTGGLFAGRESAGVVQLSRRTAEEAGIAHEMLAAQDVRSRFPAFRLADGMEAIYEPGAYMILADRARLAMLDLAIGNGTHIFFGQRVSSITAARDHITVTTDDGERIQCGSVVVATGPWLASQLVPELSAFLRPMRVPIYWFGTSNPDRFDARRFPVFLYETQNERILYGCPWRHQEDGVKVGFHNWQQVRADPDNPDREVSEDFRSEIQTYVSGFLPDLAGVAKSRICYYTMAPDGNFLIGTTREDQRVAYASACSGHGFKFASAVGEAVAGLALEETPKIDLTPYSTARLG